jgi:hypothetical protein
MFWKSYVIGSSFSRGSGLHYYTLSKEDLKIMDDITEKQRLFNYQNSYSYLLNKKLNINWPIIVDGKSKGGIPSHPTFFDELDMVLRLVEAEYIDFEPTSIQFKTRLVVIQLTSPQRNFIYKDIIYPINFQSEEEFAKSFKEITKDKDYSFFSNFESEISDFFSNRTDWELKNSEKIIERINQLIIKLQTYGVLVKIISYYGGFDTIYHKFINNAYVTLNYDNTEYVAVSDLIYHHKLKVKDDLNIDDDHPNLTAHQIVADSIYNNIMKYTPNWNTNSNVIPII